MSGYQISYAALLAFAIWCGQPSWRLSAICCVNFIGTMTLAASPISVGVLDMATITALFLVGGWRGYALAGVFVAIVPIYPIGVYLAWSNFAIYAIVDLLGYAIPGVLASGSGNGGNRSGRHFDRARRAGVLGVASVRTIFARGYRKINPPILRIGILNE